MLFIAFNPFTQKYIVNGCTCVSLFLAVYVVVCVLLMCAVVVAVCAAVYHVVGVAMFGCVAIQAIYVTDGISLIVKNGRKIK